MSAILFLLPYAKKYWQVVAIVVLAGVLMSACHARDTAIREKAAAEARSHIADSLLAVNKLEIDSLNAAVIHDTVEVSRWLRGRDLPAKRDTVYLPGDTLHERPMVQIPAAQATLDDQGALSCRNLLNDCTAFRRTAQQRFDEYETKLAAKPSITISGACTWRERAAWGAFGALGGAAGEHYVSTKRAP